MGHKFESSLKSGRVLGQSVMWDIYGESYIALSPKTTSRIYRQRGEGCFKVLTQLPIRLSHYDLGQKQVTAEDFGDDELWLSEDLDSPWIAKR